MANVKKITLNEKNIIIAKISDLVWNLRRQTRVSKKYDILKDIFKLSLKNLEVHFEQFEKMINEKSLIQTFKKRFVEWIMPKNSNVNQRIQDREEHGNKFLILNIRLIQKFIKIFNESPKN